MTNPGSQTDIDFSGRVALVTGGGRGIGRSIAVQLAEAGASVVVVARSQPELDETVEVIRGAGGGAWAVQGDLGDVTGLPELAARADGAAGPVDILVNNAATVTPLGPTMELDPIDIGAALTLNVQAPIALTALLLPGMLARRWGRIVNVSSGIAEQPRSMVGGNVYATTKSALEAHTLNLAAELDDTGVTVNVYRPGTVDTAMQGFIRGQDPDRVKSGLVERFRRMQESGTLVTPEESARSLIWRLHGSETGAVWTFTPSAAQSSVP